MVCLKMPALRAPRGLAALMSLSALLLGLSIASTDAQTASGLSGLPVQLGDPMWKPGTDQLKSWIGAGIMAASANMYLPDVAAVARWSWSGDRADPLPGGRQLRYVVMVTPQLTAVATGYDAAWNEDIYTAIQQDRDLVEGALADDVMPSFDGRNLYFAAAIRGPQLDGGQAAVYYDGAWRYAEFSLWGGLEAFIADANQPGFGDFRWAAEYVLSQDEDSPALKPAEEILVYMVRWPSHPTAALSAEFVSSLPTPTGFDGERCRLALGAPGRFAYVDFPMTPLQ